MKNRTILRAKNQIIKLLKNRLSYLFMAMVMLFSSINIAALMVLVPVIADGEETQQEESITVRDDALHFIIRHWHSGYDSEAEKLNKGKDRQYDKESREYFVLIEGYIVPIKGAKNGDDKFRVYMVNQNTGKLIDMNDSDLNGSPYIGEVKSGKGTIELMVKPLVDVNSKSRDVLENFCGFSMSAGRNAVTYNYYNKSNMTLAEIIKEIDKGSKFDSEDNLLDANGNKILKSVTISYSDTTHIVKGHAFYSSWSKTVPSTSDSTVFNPGKEEIDTAEVFTWSETVTCEEGGHKAGEIVKYKDQDGNDAACWTEDDLEKAKKQCSAIKYELDDDTYNNVKLTRFYSTNEGMHTNKTLVENGDGRIFLLDLEAWYIEGYAAQLGFVLDASGSMAFTSDVPNIINVYNAVASRLGIKLDEDGLYTYKDYKSESGKELKDFLADLAGKPGLKKEFCDIIAAKIGRTFTPSHWDTLFGRINAMGDAKPETYDTYPQHDKLIGYYEIQDNKYDYGSGNTAKNYRTWFYNSIDKDNQTKKYRNPEDYKNNGDKYSTADPEHFAKVVVYNEEGDSFDFNNQTAIIKSQDVSDSDGTPYTWGTFPINFNNSPSGNRTYGLNMRHADAGFMLTAPTGNSFTVSCILQNSYDTSDSFDKSIEILYVGAMSGNKNSGGYFRVTREGGDLKIYNGHNKDALATIGNVFGYAWNNLTTERQRFTFVFDGENVDIYLANNKRASVTVDGLAYDAIVFAPFKDYFSETSNTSGDPLFYLDDIFVYDTNLSASEVSQFVSAYNVGYVGATATTNIDEQQTEINWNNVFLDEDVLAVLLNPRNTADTLLGVAAYNYFVFDGNDSTKEYAPLAYWDGAQAESFTYKRTSDNKSMTSTAAKTSQGETLGELLNVSDGQAGWYYLSHGSENGILTEIETAKRLFGLVEDVTVEDKASLPGSGGDTKKQYKTSSSPNRFYIDENGNLRCFFSRGTDNSKSDNTITQCSYVYELTDNQYVKTEALQRVLAEFYTNLFEYSPASKISAVRFSNAAFDPKELVLLDWSDDMQEIAGILSQTRGKSNNKEGDATGYDTSAAGLNQYNYVLTGGTYTNTGLKAFYEYLVQNKGDALGTTWTDGKLTRRDDENSPKFVVVITDGADTGNKEESKALADSLKAAGYTILGVYLPGGADAYDDNGNIIDTDGTIYAQARDFLKTIAGKKGTSQADALKKYVFASTDLSEVHRIFEEQILAQISGKMTGYTVQDYIDPRFDLETADGNIVWHLNAKGKVVKSWYEQVGVDKDGVPILKERTETIDVTKLDPDTTDWYTFHLAGDSTPGARDPYLRYDSAKDMYYLRWENQDIQSSPVDSNTMLPVWTAQVRLRAKDDFIGGNAIITNGNDKKMNWVYHPYDTESMDSDEAKHHTAVLTMQFGEEFGDLTDDNKQSFVNEYVKGLADKTGWVIVDDDGNPTETVLPWSKLKEEQKNEVIAGYIVKELKKAQSKKSGHNANSGTSDMKKSYDKKTENGNEVDDKNNPTDEYVSKGFPRATVNVQLLQIDVNPIYDVIYMGEVVSPAQLLRDIEGSMITDSYYLDYLKRYAYQRYLHDPRSNEANLPLLELLNDWLQFNNDEDYQKSFSVPYMYLPSVEYDPVEGNILFDEDENGNKQARLLNSTGFNTEEYEYGKVFNNKTGIRADVVGILTYRWEQLEPDPQTYDADGNETMAGASAATKNYVKDDTERVRYAITIGYTPLREGDVLGVNKDGNPNGKCYWIDSKTGKEYEGKDGSKVPTPEEFNVDPERYFYTGLNAHDDEGKDIFADYLPIRNNGKSDKWVWYDAAPGEDRVNGAFIFDREKRVNGYSYEDEKGNQCLDVGYIRETITVTNDGNEVTKTVFGWNPSYKPAVYKQQLVNYPQLYTNTEETVQLINEGPKYDKENDNEIINDRTDPRYETISREYKGDPRTIKGYSVYTLNVVSGGMALELKLQNGELDKLINDANGEDIEFKVNAARRFVDTDFAERTLKTAMDKDGNVMDDFGRINYYYYNAEDPDDQKNGTSIDWAEDNPHYKYGIWTITFTVDTQNRKQGKHGYVTVYANATEIIGWFGNENTSEEDGWRKWDELPVGAYEFSLAEANKLALYNNEESGDEPDGYSLSAYSATNGVTGNGIQFSTIGAEDEGENFQTKYFNDVVLNGLYTSNEKQRTKKDANGDELLDEDGNPIYMPTMAQKRNEKGELQYMYKENDPPKVDGFTYKKNEEDPSQSGWYKGDNQEIIYMYNKTQGIWKDSEGNVLRDSAGRSVSLYWYDSEFTDGKETGIWRDADGYKVPDIWAEGSKEIVDNEKDDENNDENNYKTGSIATYVAYADSITTKGKESSTFFIGTTTTIDGNNVVKDNAYKQIEERAYYPPHRLGILKLQTGTVKLTIKEDGENSKANESFLYRVHGRSISYETPEGIDPEADTGEDVDIYVSVKGGGSTTIDIVAGTYTVEEVSSWSWRYEGGVIVPGELADGELVGTYESIWYVEKIEDDDGNITEIRKKKQVLSTSKEEPNKSNWTITEVDGVLVNGTIKLDTTTYEAVITFTHKRNNKTWVGGENHVDLTFEHVQQQEQGPILPGQDQDNSQSTQP
ncbi:MAG: VWA domain-containing protein [Clostridiales bacterium]|nr:VWA domain-containing protein [Clostridiales bacterium]